MTAAPGERTAASPAPGGLDRRRLLAMGLGTAVGGAGLLSRPAGARPTRSPLLGSLAGGGEQLATRPDVAGDWFAQLVATPLAFGPPGVADRLWAVTWMSALGALAPTAGRPRSGAPRARYEDAAVAQALHDALVAQVPDQAGRLAVALADTLAAVPDGDAKQAGVDAGREAAARTLTERQGDGLDPASLNPPYSLPPEAPGVYRPPPGATGTHGAGFRFARPFFLGRADRFRPGPPPGLGSEEYRTDLAELQATGGADSPRSEHQALIAWLAPAMQYTPALAAALGGMRRPLAWKVHLLAAYATAVLDAQIATSDAKFTYLHWRPVTAIRAADTDGDPLTVPDATWSSYLPTPPNPEYPSAHGAIAGAAEQVLEHFVGRRTPVGFTATVVRPDGQVVGTRAYPRGTSWTTLTQENVDARVWAGVHWRFSDEVGATLGRRVGDHCLSRLTDRSRSRHREAR